MTHTKLAVLLFPILTLLSGGEVAHADPMTVVLDPGHGGSSTGAVGAAGASEKQVTLAVARRVRALLEQRGVRVVLTRNRDVYLTLRARARKVRRQPADCFVSLHANATPTHNKSGVETYVLSRDVLDVEARRLRELHQPADPVGGILAELARIDAHGESIALARRIEARLAQRPTTTGEPPIDRGVKQADYDVLSEVAVPAVLVEMGFIDHPLEGVELLSRGGQQRVAAAIAAGILDFGAARALPQLAALDPR